MVKIAFFDIDGTLVDPNRKQPSGKILETLKGLKEKNIIICIATGRAPMELPHFEGVEFDAFLTFNGSYCYNNKEMIFGNSIPTEDVRTIIDNARSINRPLSLATGSRLAANGKDRDLIEYYGFANIEVEVAEDFDEVAKEKIYQIMMGCVKEDYPLILKGVKDVKITYWWDRAVDIIPANGGKGLGIRKVLEYYDIDKSEAIAFGDGNNDIEMLQNVGCGVAMANGSDDLKQIAYDICGDVTEDGVYYYCLEKGLI